VVVGALGGGAVSQDSCEKHVDWLNKEHGSSTLIKWLQEVLSVFSKQYADEKAFVITVLLAGLPLTQDAVLPGLSPRDFVC
jgi:hypothetical protein